MAFCRACRPSWKAPPSASEPIPFCVFGSRPSPEGLVIKNHRVASLIKLAAIVMWVLTIGFYIVVSAEILTSFELLKALGIILFITPCFLLAWRLIPLLKTDYTEQYAMGPADSDLGGTEPVKYPTRY